MRIFVKRLHLVFQFDALLFVTEELDRRRCRNSNIKLGPARRADLKRSGKQLCCRGRGLGACRPVSILVMKVEIHYCLPPHLAAALNTFIGQV